MLTILDIPDNKNHRGFVLQAEIAPPSIMSLLVIEAACDAR